MAAWYTVYCTRPMDRVAVADIRAEIDGWDFHTAAEMYDIDDDEVDRAVESLKLEAAPEPGDVRFRLTYGPPERRPILIHVWSNPKRIAEEQSEGLEKLENARSLGVGRVRAHLGRLAAVVAIELGWSQLEDMGAVFAGMLAEYLAHLGDGLMLDPHDAWWAMEDRVPIQIAGPGTT